jgi:hypothetical protein
MPVKKKTTKRKKSVGSTIGSYVRKLMSAAPVKRAALSIKELEKKLIAAKKKKAAAVKVARKKLKK